MSRRRRKRKNREQPLEADHPDYTEPSCSHFGTCGGCRWQDHQYSAQLERMHRELVDALTPLGEALANVDEVIGAERIFHYRNKMDFTFARRRWVENHEPEGVAKDFGLGLHVPRRFDKVLDIRECWIAFEEAEGIVDTTRRWALEHEVPPWDVYEHVGQLRHLVLRKAEATSEIMVQLVTTEEDRSRTDSFFETLREGHPEVTTGVQTVNSGVAMVATGDDERLVFGDGVIRERVLDREFVISPLSFFQTNTEQASRLAEIVLDELKPQASDVLFDLCCGGGFFSVLASPRVREVWGFEIVESATRDAERNSQRNEIRNAHFVTGDLVTTLDPENVSRNAIPHPDVCIVDPPRAGLHEKVCQRLIDLGPRRVVFVSCHPKMALPNLMALCEAGYALEAIRPIDLFPHTPHIECVFALVKTG